MKTIVNLSNRSSTKKYIKPIYFLLLGLISFTLIVLKAKTASFTHDESLSYLRYVPKNFMEIISLVNPSANNHILNTLLMKYFELGFGNKEWALRLPNILSFLVFSTYIFKIIKRNSLVLFFAFVPVIILNPYFIDMFSCGRGYGISYGFLIVSIYYLIKFAENLRMKYYVLALVFILLATLSSLTIIYVLLSYLLIFNLLQLETGSKSKNIKLKWLLKKNGVNLLFAGLSISILFEPFRKLIQSHELYYGGNVGIWKDSIHSILETAFYKRNYFFNFELVVKFFTAFLLLFLFFLCIWWFYKKQKNEYYFKNPLVILAVILTTVFLIIEINHLLLGTLFIISRSAFFLFPIFLLSVLFAFQLFLAEKEFRIPPAITAAVTIIFCFTNSFHLFQSYSKTKYLEWPQDENVKEMLMDLEKDIAILKTKKEKITLGIWWVFEPSVNYYRKAYNYQGWLNEVDRNRFNENQDYMYTVHNQVDILPNVKLTPIEDYKETKSILYKNEEKEKY